MKTTSKIIFRACYVVVLSLGFSACGDDASNTEHTTKADDSDTTGLVDSSDLDSGLVEIDTLALDTVEAIEPPKEVLGQESKAQAATVAKKKYDLSEYGFDFTIDLPAGTSMTVNDFDELEMNFGQDFTMVLGENYDGAISQIKGKFKNTIHNEHLGYLKDETNGIVKKSKANGIITHSLFYTLNENAYIVKSVPSKTYNKAEIMEMWKACASIQMK